MATKRGRTQAARRAKAPRSARGARRTSVRASPRSVRAEELGAEPRALVGRDEDARAVRPRKDDASVEDPLGDWPED